MNTVNVSVFDVILHNYIFSQTMKVGSVELLYMNIYIYMYLFNVSKMTNTQGKEL